MTPSGRATTMSPCVAPRPAHPSSTTSRRASPGSPAVEMASSSRVTRRRIRGRASAPDGGRVGQAPSYPTAKEPTMGDKTDQAKGRIKEAAGDITGDKDLQREGKVDRKSGEVKEKVGDTVDKVKDAIHRD